MHYKDPHTPYAAPLEFEMRFHYLEPSRRPLTQLAKRKHRLARSESEARDPLYFVDRYDEEILYVDEALGRLIDGYAELAPLDEALLIFTADHGESLLERPWWFTHGYQVWEELVRVPLLIRGPGVTPGRRTERVSGIDIAPTVLAAAGVAAPPSMSGIDLRTIEADLSERAIFFESANLGSGQLRDGE